MINRRDFLQLSLATATGLATRKLWATAGSRAIGVQLYTVRDQAERDLPSVLAAIQKIGYREVETYWNVYTHPATELRKMIADHGLSVPSGHFNYEGLDSKLDYAKVLGVDFVICPMLPESLRSSLDGFKRAADQLNVWGKQAHERGLQLGFHNHNYEFHQFGDTNGFDTLVQNTDPNLVCLEMDCYWVTQAGRDPLQMFKEYGSRIKLLHLKDRKQGFGTSQELNNAAQHFTEVGSGTLNWKAILAAADQNGVKHVFVERDSGDLPAIESLRKSFQYLQTLA
jgi:sugar phosphate isomerase/epimerase